MAEGRLSDWISLGVLASSVLRDAVDEAMQAAGKGAKRKGGKNPGSCWAGDRCGKQLRGTAEGPM